MSRRTPYPFRCAASQECDNLRSLGGSLLALLCGCEVEPAPVKTFRDEREPCFARGPVSFDLPGHGPRVIVKTRHERLTAEVVAHTLEIEPGDQRSV